MRALATHAGTNLSQEMVDRTCNAFRQYQGPILGTDLDVALLNATLRSVNNGLLDLLERLGAGKAPDAFSTGLRE